MTAQLIPVCVNHTVFVSMPPQRMISSLLEQMVELIEM